MVFIVIMAGIWMARAATVIALAIAKPWEIFADASKAPDIYAGDSQEPAERFIPMAIIRRRR